MDLKELQKKAIQFRDDRDWKRFHNPKDLALSINIEAGELAELFQWKTNEEIKEMLKDPKKLEALKHELADIMLYCLDMAEETGIDPEKAILEKLEHNAKKYPIEKAKGSNKKYSEL
ncbi:MAG: nucleotide pyrophosphohydrolase [Candidatus Diapherotrites archaeon]|nr:nucleotide pyrophosphohydrolase [Candidatus Diapherotrites archaeon]